MSEIIGKIHLRKIGVDSLKNLKKIKTGGKNMSKIFGTNMNQIKMRVYMNKKQVM